MLQMNRLIGLGCFCILHRKNNCRYWLFQTAMSSYHVMGGSIKTCELCLSLSVVFLLTVQGAAISLLMFQVCLCYDVLSVSCSLTITWLERADLLALWYVRFSCVLSPSHMVSRVRYGT